MAATRSTSIGAVQSVGGDGKISIPLDPAIPVGEYFYDLQAQTNEGKKVTVAYGVYKVRGDITK